MLNSFKSGPLLHRLVCQGRSAFVRPQSQTKLDETKTNPFAYRCSINDPTKHDLEHVGKFYTIPLEDMDMLDRTKVSMEKDHISIANAFQEQALMIRRPAVEIIKDSESLNDKSEFDITKYIIYGEQNGVGKRSTIIHLLHYFSKKNWLLFHVPNSSYPLRLAKEIQPSESDPNLFNTPFEATKFLERFLSQNSSLLADKMNIKTVGSYKWDLRESTQADTPLVKMLELGIERPKFSTDIFAALVNEIKVQATDKKFKVFIAIDQFNSYFGKTSQYKIDKTPLEPDNFALVHHFKKLLQNDWKNGLFAGSIGSLGVINPSNNRKKKHHDSTMDDARRRRVASDLHYEGPTTPQALLNDQANQLLGAYKTIKVQNFSESEINNYIDYYIEKNWLQTPYARTDDGREEIKFLSGCNPAQFRRFCQSL